MGGPGLAFGAWIRRRLIANARTVVTGTVHQKALLFMKFLQI
jgi:hypothetical protein